MKAKVRADSLCLDIVEKDERLEQLAQIARTHEPGYRAMAMTGSACNDASFFIHHVASFYLVTTCCAMKARPALSSIDRS